MREQCRGGEGGDGPPELPPRPPHLLPLSPRPPAPHAPAYSPPTPGDPHHCTVSSPSTSPWYSPLTQKYVLLTLICGGLSVVLGALFMAIYLTVKSTTTSLHYFQTIPTYVPAIAVRSNIFINSLSKVRFILSIGCSDGEIRSNAVGLREPSFTFPTKVFHQASPLPLHYYVNLFQNKIFLSQFSLME